MMAFCTVSYSYWRVQIMRLCAVRYLRTQRIPLGIACRSSCSTVVLRIDRLPFRFMPGLLVHFICRDKCFTFIVIYVVVINSVFLNCGDPMEQAVATERFELTKPRIASEWKTVYPNTHPRSPSPPQCRLGTSTTSLSVL